MVKKEVIDCNTPQSSDPKREHHDCEESPEVRRQNQILKVLEFGCIDWEGDGDTRDHIGEQLFLRRRRRVHCRDTGETNTQTLKKIKYNDLKKNNIFFFNSNFSWFTKDSKRWGLDRSRRLRVRPLRRRRRLRAGGRPHSPAARRAP